MSLSGQQKVRVGPVLVSMAHIQELQALAAEHDRSVAAEIRHAIRVYVESARRRKAAQASQPQPPAA